MTNQISKQSILDYIDNQIISINDSMESYTTKGKYYQILEQQRAILLQLNFNIKNGLFDEKDLDILNKGKVTA